MGYRSIIALLLVLGGLFAADQFMNSGAALVFLARKLADLIEYLAIWR